MLQRTALLPRKQQVAFKTGKSKWNATKYPKFANWTIRQRQQLYGAKKFPFNSAKINSQPLQVPKNKALSALPGIFNAADHWRPCSIMINFVRDQGLCRSCWVTKKFDLHIWIYLLGKTFHFDTCNSAKPNALFETIIDLVGEWYKLACLVSNFPKPQFRVLGGRYSSSHQRPYMHLL